MALMADRALNTLGYEYKPIFFSRNSNNKEKNQETVLKVKVYHGGHIYIVVVVNKQKH